MEKPQTLEDFYASHYQWIPNNLKTSIGHFNVFKLDEYASEKPKPMPYNRRDYYKISLVKGRAKVQYADKIVAVEKQAMVFSHPHIPYNWVKIDAALTGYFCLFTETFFHQFGNLADYPIYQPGGKPVFSLTDEEVNTFESVFQKMFKEINSDYAFKYDVLRNLVFELIHAAMKLQPANTTNAQQSNASERIASLFMELLERQFPIEHIGQKIILQSPSDFAKQLNVHVNHLNRALKEATQKTTSEIIAERVFQEAKILLKYSNWNVSEIAHCLGFTETAHFSNSFKKQAQVSPAAFRKLELV